MFTQLMRESRIYGHNKGHLTSCSKCKEFKEYFEKNVLQKIDSKLFYKMVDKEKEDIKNYKENADIYLGYKLQSKYWIKQHFSDRINLAVPYNIIINKDNLTQMLLNDLPKLPNQFVIKKNKLSGYTLVVDKLGQILYQEQKYQYTVANLYEILTTVLRYDYDKNPTKDQAENKEMDLFVEEYIPVNEEFKFHTIHGRVIMIEHYLIATGLHSNKWYTRDWKEINLIGRDDPYPYYVYPNSRLKEYVETAEMIASKVSLDYIRVDCFTNMENKLFFGELSHSPNAFHNNYEPHDFDILLYDLYTKQIPIEEAQKKVNEYVIYDKQIKLKK